MADDDRFAEFRKRAGPIKDGHREPDPFLCRHLRTKAWYVPDSFRDRDFSESSSTTQCWCLRTLRAFGPDGDLVTPEACTDERLCFEPAMTAGKDDS
jgi:hypothetical protein